MIDIQLTLHSIRRFMERFGLTEIDDCEAQAERAWRNGKTSNEYGGEMRKKLMRIEKSNPNIKVKIHEKNCYIFTIEGLLITVYSLISIYDKLMNNLKPYEETEINEYGEFEIFMTEKIRKKKQRKYMHDECEPLALSA